MQKRIIKFKHNIILTKLLASHMSSVINFCFSKLNTFKHTSLKVKHDIFIQKTKQGFRDLTKVIKHFFETRNIFIQNSNLGLAVFYFDSSGLAGFYIFLFLVL